MISIWNTPLTEGSTLFCFSKIVYNRLMFSFCEFCNFFVLRKLSYCGPTFNIFLFSADTDAQTYSPSNSIQLIFLNTWFINKKPNLTASLCFVRYFPWTFWFFSETFLLLSLYFLGLFPLLPLYFWGTLPGCLRYFLETSL